MANSFHKTCLQGIMLVVLLMHYVTRSHLHDISMVSLSHDHILMISSNQYSDSEETIVMANSFHKTCLQGIMLVVLLMRYVTRSHPHDIFKSIF